MQPIWSDGLFCSIRLSATNGVHFGSALKSRTTAQTALAGAGITAELYTFAMRRALPAVVVDRRWSAANRVPGLSRFGGQVGDVLGVAQDFGHAAETAALDADLLHQAVDHRRLNAIAQRRIDDFVGDVAIARARRRSRRRYGGS